MKFRPYPKGDERKKACLEELRKIELQKGTVQSVSSTQSLIQNYFITSKWLLELILTLINFIVQAATYHLILKL